MFWLSPYVSPDSPEYRDLAKKGAFVLDPVENHPAIVPWWNGYSAMLDMSNPVNCQWLSGKLKEMQEKYGVDGFKFEAGRKYKGGKVYTLEVPLDRIPIFTKVK